MKKIVLVLSIIMMLLTNTMLYATENKNDVVISQSEHSIIEREENKTSVSDENIVQKEEISDNVTPASKKILDNTSKKDKKISEYMEKYGNQTFAYTAYYLDLIQLYSIPVCIIGITLGAFNFYIVGEKKLDKREKGFSSITAFLCAFVLFQALPLIFALIAAGR